MDNNLAARFEELIFQNEGIIRKIVNIYCHDENERADLSQEITLNLWHSFPRYDESFKFSTWMYRVALNVAITHYRKNKTRQAWLYKITDPANLGKSGKKKLLTLLCGKNLMEVVDFMNELNSYDKNEQN
jgi:RNA polymerase sigma factor (sigma-70 family)